MNLMKGTIMLNEIKHYAKVYCDLKDYVYCIQLQKIDGNSIYIYQKTQSEYEFLILYLGVYTNNDYNNARNVNVDNVFNIDSVEASRDNLNSNKIINPNTCIFINPKDEDRHTENNTSIWNLASISNKQIIAIDPNIIKKTEKSQSGIIKKDIVIKKLKSLPKNKSSLSESENIDLSEIRDNEVNIIHAIPISISYKSMHQRSSSDFVIKKQKPNTNKFIYNKEINPNHSEEMNSVMISNRDNDNNYIKGYTFSECDEIDYNIYDIKQTSYANIRLNNIFRVFSTNVINPHIQTKEKDISILDPRIDPTSSPTNIAHVEESPKFINFSKITTNTFIKYKSAEKLDYTERAFTFILDNKELKDNSNNDISINNNNPVINFLKSQSNRTNKSTSFRKNSHDIEFNQCDEYVDDKERCLYQGIQFLYNFKLTQAKKCFINYSNEDLLFELMMIECDLAEICLTGKKKDIEGLINILNKFIVKINHNSTSYKEDFNLFFMQELNKGEALIMKGFLNAVMGNKFQSFKNLAESWRIYKKLEILIKNSFQKAKIQNQSIWRHEFGYGVFNLAFSLIPKSMIRIIKFIGINPSKDEGIKNLELLSKTESIRALHASLLLCLYTIEFTINADYASGILYELLKKYPECPLVYWVGSTISWQQRKVDEVYFMAKNALFHVGDMSERATYLLYELAWYYFLTFRWNDALRLFEKIIISVVNRKFLLNAEQEIQYTIKSRKLKDYIGHDFDNNMEIFSDPKIQNLFYLYGSHKIHNYGYSQNNNNKICNNASSTDSISHDNISDINIDENISILPNIASLMIMLSVTNFQLNNLIQGIKWLILTISISYKKNTLFKNTSEEDFAKLALKYICRSSKFLLTYEVFYFLRYLSKLSDDIILDISTAIDQYLNDNIEINPIKLLDKNYYHNINQDKLHDYFSGMLIITINNCLLGETLAVCSIINIIEPILDLIKDDYLYIKHHFIYWFSKALIIEKQIQHAKELLKRGVKISKCEFCIVNKMKKLLTSLNQYIWIISE